MVGELKGVGRDESLRMDQLINKWEVGQVTQVWTHNDPDDYNWQHCDVLVVDEVPSTTARVPSNGPVYRLRVPVLQQMVGNRSGRPWTPRVGDSVLMGFYQNDRPVIFGTLPMRYQVPVCRSSDNPAPLPDGAHEVWTEANYHNLYDYRLKLVQWLHVPRRTIPDGKGGICETTFNHSQVTLAGKLRPVCFNYFDKTRDIMLVSECKKGKNAPDCKQCELNGDNTGEGPDYIKAECDPMTDSTSAMNFWVKMLSTDYCGQDDLARRFKVHWPCGSRLCADSMETGDNEGRIWLESQNQHQGRSHIHYRAEKTGAGANLSLRSAPAKAAHIELFGINDPKKGRVLIKNEDIGNFVDVKEINEVEIEASKILLDGDVEITGSCTHNSCSCDGEFAALDGVAGGQTICGGTGVDEELTLCGTSDASKGQVTVDADLECNGALCTNIKASIKTYGDTLYAASGSGVTNGDSHDHSGGDGAQVDHGNMGGLTDDDHSQYVKLVGRSGGQTIKGGTDSGDNLILESTTNATKGIVCVPDGQKFVVGEDPYGTTNAVAGWGFQRYTDGNLYTAWKTITGGSIYLRCGAGTETGYARTFLTITPSTGACYFLDNVSALSFTDRTPGYDGDALAELKNVINDKLGHVDHKTLPAFAKSTFVDSATGQETEGRNIGNMVSILTKAVQQLTGKLEAAEQRIAELEAKDASL